MQMPKLVTSRSLNKRGAGWQFWFWFLPASRRWTASWGEIVSELGEVEAWVKVELWRRLLGGKRRWWRFFREQSSGGGERVFFTPHLRTGGGLTCPWTCLVLRDLRTGWQRGNHHLLQLLHGADNLEQWYSLISSGMIRNLTTLPQSFELPWSSP